MDASALLGASNNAISHRRLADRLLMPFAMPQRAADGLRLNQASPRSACSSRSGATSIRTVGVAPPSSERQTYQVA